MGAPIKLPGLLGRLSAEIGVARLADSLAQPTRTLRHWAHNESCVPALAAAKIADLAARRGITPPLYTHPGLPTHYVASAPEGWVIFGSSGYAARARYQGPLVGLVAADAGIRLAARAHGWPW